MRGDGTPINGADPNEAARTLGHPIIGWDRAAGFPAVIWTGEDCYAIDNDHGSPLRVLIGRNRDGTFAAAYPVK